MSKVSPLPRHAFQCPPAHSEQHGTPHTREEGGPGASDSSHVETKTNDSTHHGWADLADTTRTIYFDLGGEFNLADNALYQHVLAAADRNPANVQLLHATDLGHPFGVPIDMAAGTNGTSSIVRVHRWARLNIVVNTAQGRTLHLSEQTVGFVHRSSPLLLLGQSACKLCGYRTIEQQDADHERANARRPMGTSTGELSVTDFERRPMGLTCTPITYAKRRAQHRARELVLDMIDMDYVQPIRRPSNDHSTEIVHDLDDLPSLQDVSTSDTDDSELDDEGWRPNSPTTVLDVDFVDIPSLVEQSDSDDSDEDGDTTDENALDELYTIPAAAIMAEPDAGPPVSRAHMQRAQPAPQTPAMEEAETACATPQTQPLFQCDTTAVPPPATSNDPAKVQHYLGDILDSKATFIVHQTNCVTKSPAGLAAQIFRRFPYADCYSQRTAHDWPGTIDVAGEGPQQRIVNLHGQFAPGKPRLTGRDTPGRRLTYFQAGLLSLEDHIRMSGRKHTTVVFPARIGCGLAGGNWEAYLQCINNFARRINFSRARTTTVQVCHLPSEEDDESLATRDAPTDQSPQHHTEGHNDRADSYSRAGPEESHDGPGANKGVRDDAERPPPPDEVDCNTEVVDLTSDNEHAANPVSHGTDATSPIPSPQTESHDVDVIDLSNDPGQSTNSTKGGTIVDLTNASEADQSQSEGPTDEITDATNLINYEPRSPIAKPRLQRKQQHRRSLPRTIHAVPSPPEMDTRVVEDEPLPRLRQKVIITDRYGAPAKAQQLAGLVDRAVAGEQLRQYARPIRNQSTKHLSRARPVKLRVATSTIPDAGQGLFCEEHVRPGETVARYSGKILTKQQADASSSRYILKISNDVYLDAGSPDTWEGRWINDGPHSGREANCVFAAAFNTNVVPGSKDRWIKVFATKHIQPGEELLMDYGISYWDDHARPPGAAATQYLQQSIKPEQQPGMDSGCIATSGVTLDLLEEVNAQLPDALAYIGHHAYKHVLGTDVFYCERAPDSFITTAVLRRSGRHPEAPTGATTQCNNKPNAGQNGRPDPPMWEWLQAGGTPNSVLHEGDTINMHNVVVLKPDTHKVMLHDVPLIVVPGNKMRCIMGRTLWGRINDANESDESPLQHKTSARCEQEVEDSLSELVRQVYGQPDLGHDIKRQTEFLLRVSCKSMWRAKFDLQSASFLPPMEIRLQPGATPTKIRRHYRWSEEQDRFLERHLRDLVDAGIISHIESEWLCPIVLVRKNDDSWRLCVDPATLNQVTIPMTWEVPRIRAFLQDKLCGCSWFSKFDFVSMFWQLSLHPDSRKLFSFFAGRHGSYCFNRVAMGALNSSVYTQKMLTRIFQNVRFRGKPILGNGLVVQTDDVLLFAPTARDLLALTVLFVRTVMVHNLAIHPNKCLLFQRALIYCGLHVSGQGVTVDPERLQGLQALPYPATIGDVWRFKASVGWMRPDVPLLAVAEDKLNQLITAALKGLKKRDMKAADRIPIMAAGWTDNHREAWDLIKAALSECITTSFRNRLLIACIFTDASSVGWAICITQCAREELNKPWAEQRHELLAVTSGLFRNAQRNWAMACKEAYPIVVAINTHRQLLQGNFPFVSINDHQSLKYVFAGPLRTPTVGKPAQGRLARWATFLRSFVFDVQHIPGAENMFCDLLSRNGCSTATLLHARLHDQLGQLQHTAQQDSTTSAGKQYAIVMPAGVPPAKVANRSRDLNVHRNPLLPSLKNTLELSAANIAEAQTQAALQSPTFIDVDGNYLLVDSSNKVIIPAPVAQHGGLLDQLLVVAHQGDQHHRSSEETADVFMRTFAIHGHSEAATKRYITRRCRSCLGCIKLRTGGTVPRPLWFMVRATRPWEYVHADFIEMPKATNGMVWMLVLVDDLSLTTLLHPCEACTAEVFINVFINEWLSHHPDPVLLHTDGGTHFDNEIVRGIAQACGLRHTISTAYAKWAYGVAERMNKAVLQVLRPLLRGLGHAVNQWPKVTKLVQRALQRKRRPSRNNMSPLQLTTGIEPRDAVTLIVNEGLDVQQVDGPASELLDNTVQEMATLLEKHWDLANTARRAKSEENRRRTDMTALPDIALGDYVLYAQFVPDTKLDYKWRGPAQVIHRVNPRIYIIDPVGVEQVQPFAVHVTLLRRFASSQLDVTEQMLEEIHMDHPDNIVHKLVNHKMDDGDLWFQIRWLGFTAERDTWQKASVINESCPDRILQYYRRRNTNRDPHLMRYIRTAFPNADADVRNLQRTTSRRHFRRRRTHRATTIPVVTTPVNNAGATQAPPPAASASPRRRRGRPRRTPATQQTTIPTITVPANANAVTRDQQVATAAAIPLPTQRRLTRQRASATSWPGRGGRGRGRAGRRGRGRTAARRGRGRPRRRAHTTAQPKPPTTTPQLSKQPGIKLRRRRKSRARTTTTPTTTRSRTRQPAVANAVESAAEQLARTKAELAAAAQATATARTLQSEIQQRPATRTYNLRRRQQHQYHNAQEDDIFAGMEMVPHGGAAQQ